MRTYFGTAAYYFFQCFNAVQFGNKYEIIKLFWLFNILLEIKPCVFPLGENFLFKNYSGYIFMGDSEYVYWKHNKNNVSAVIKNNLCYFLFNPFLYPIPKPRLISFDFVFYHWLVAGFSTRDQQSMINMSKCWINVLSDSISDFSLQWR